MRKRVLSIHNDMAMYCSVAVLSVLCFCLIYGVKVINPTYDDWLLSGGDLQQHYLGWIGFRNSRWYFPFGLMDTLTYPSTTSIIFTDSIPLFAVFFKLLSPVLPDTFQYFGFWGVMSFALQGIMAARILKQYTDNNVVTASASIIFAVTPTVLQRMFGHTSLAGQWIILFALHPLLSSQKYSEKRLTKTAMIMGIISAASHIYFLLISGIILVGICIREIIETKRLKNSLKILLVYLSVAVAVVALLGGFSVSGDYNESGLGKYSMNLNALINPQGFSRIFLSLPLYDSAQYEGFMYIGAGFLLICILAAFVALDRLAFVNRDYEQSIPRIVAVLVTVLISVMVAVSPVITFGDRVLVENQYPDFIIKLMTVFRATGRIAWNAMYLTMLCGCIMVCRFLDWRRAVVVFACAFSLQVFDVYNVLKGINVRFDQRVEYESGLNNDPAWRTIAEEEEIEHVVWYDDYYYNIPDSPIFSIAEWALDNGKTVNDFYISRKNRDVIIENTEKALNELNESNAYIFSVNSKNKCFMYDLNYYIGGQYIIGYEKKLEGLTPLSQKDFCCEIGIGQEIIFLADGYNASNYVYKGLYNPESWGSWTSGYEFGMCAISNTDAKRLRCEMAVGVYNSQQNISVSVNGNVVYEGIATGETVVFDFENPGIGEILDIQIYMPDAVSPKELGDSEDDRVIALGMKNIRFFAN